MRNLLQRQNWAGQTPGIFRDPVKGRAFFDRLFSILERDSAKLEYRFRDLIYEYRDALTTTETDRIMIGVVNELLQHDEERQLLAFALIPIMSQKAERKALRRLLQNSRYTDVKQEAIDWIADLDNSLQRFMLYRFALRTVKKALYSRNRQTRNHAIPLITRFPVGVQMKIYRSVYRSSYRYHNTQLRTVHTIESLPDDTKIKLINRLMNMRDADEKIILEALDLLPSISEDRREDMLIMMMKNAPYDSVAVRVIESIHHIPLQKRSDSLHRIAYKNLRDVIQAEDDELRMFAVSLISRFPPHYRAKLIEDALDSYHRDASMAALKNIITLPNESKRQMLRMALLRNDSIDGEKNLLSQAIKIISLLDRNSRGELYELAERKISDYLDAVLKNRYYYNHLHLLSSIPYLPELTTREQLQIKGEQAVRNVLEDNKKIAQQVAVKSILYLRENSQQDLILKALQSEYEDVIIAVRNVIDRLPLERYDELEPYYLETICKRQILEELRRYELNTVYEKLSHSGKEKPLEIFPALNEIRVYSVFELYRFLKRSVLNNDVADHMIIERMEKQIRSDNEKIGLLYHFFYEGQDILMGASTAVRRALYRLAIVRHRVKEKGLAGDLSAILQEYAARRLDPVAERPIIETYLQEQGIRLFDFLIYEKYRSLSSEKRNEFTKIIHDLTSSILNGNRFADIRAEMERVGLLAHVNENFIFAILVQLLPIESSHLPRTDARKIFFDALKLEDEILSDLPRVSPAFVEDQSGRGISLRRPSREIIYSQTKSFHFELIPDLLQKSIQVSATVDPGSIMTLLQSVDRSELAERLEAYTIYHLRDQLEDVYHRYQSLKTRYESLNALADLMSETFRDILRPGINRLKQDHSREVIQALLRDISERMEIELPLTRYIGRLKPGAAVKLLQKSYFDRGKSLDEFLRENIMYLESPSREQLSWQRLISFLRRKKDNSYYNPELADDLERAVEQFATGEYTGRVESLINTADRDPLTVLFDFALDRTWSQLRLEVERGIESFDQKEEVPGPDTTYRVGKSAWLSIFGGLADICIARDTRLFARDNFTLLSMLQEDRYVGFNLLHAAEEEEGWILVLAGCEPASFYASRHAPGQIYEEVVDVLAELAQKGGFTKVVQIADENAFSNRDKIKQYIKHRVARGRPDGYLRRALYLGSYGVTTFRAQAYYLLRDLR